MRFIVYLTTNLTNGKKYIGSHATEDINDGYLGSGRIFLKALQKYGKENFKREILHECENIHQARKLEAPNIIKYKTLVPKGYNVNENGGWGYNGITHGPLTRKRISEALKGKPCPEERRKRISISCKGIQAGEKHPFWGKKHSEETLQKISQSRKGQHAGEKHHYFGKERDSETKLKISETLQGRKTPNEIKKKLSEAGKNVKKIKCEYCGKECAPWTIGRHRKTHKNI